MDIGDEVKYRGNPERFEVVYVSGYGCLIKDKKGNIIWERQSLLDVSKDVSRKNIQSNEVDFQAG